jgi:hypothetical protein
MGAWELGPYENDDAQEFLTVAAIAIEGRIMIALKPKLTEYRYNTVLAACQLLIELPERISVLIGIPTWTLASDRIASILAADDWIRSWVDPVRQSEWITKRKVVLGLRGDIEVRLGTAIKNQAKVQKALASTFGRGRTRTKKPFTP